MKEKSENIILIEQKLIYLILMLFKSMRYLFRILFKIVRLIYRFLKNILYKLLLELEPYIETIQEKIYLRACKAFDIKVEKNRDYH